MSLLSPIEAFTAGRAAGERYSKPAKTEDIARYDIVLHDGDRETVTGVLVRSSDFNGPVVVYQARIDGVDRVLFWALGSSIKFIRRLLEAGDKKDAA